MFTGLIEEVGHIVSVVRRGRIIDFTVEAHTLLDEMKIGDSIAINGACLTVTGIGHVSFTVQAVEETLRRTTLERLSKGNPVNLERSLRLSDRLGGHLVQGHIDGTGRIIAKKWNPENVLLSIVCESELDRYIVEKGSIAVDGVSLTVTYAKKGEFGVSIIPYTLKTTTLGVIRTGDTVNLETDIIVKYLEKLFKGEGSLTLSRLKELGF